MNSSYCKSCQVKLTSCTVCEHPEQTGDGENVRVCKGTGEERVSEGRGSSEGAVWFTRWTTSRTQRLANVVESQHPDLKVDHFWDTALRQICDWTH
jgi:hypothetical protein